MGMYKKVDTSLNFVEREKKIVEYVDALKKELIARNQYLGNDKVKTIYFGGGTPSLLPTKYID